MTRQQRITAAQVRAKRDEALRRLKDTLGLMHDPLRQSSLTRYDDLLLQLQKASSDFSIWTTVLRTLEIPSTGGQYADYNPYVVAVGNPFDGIQLVGPFECVDDANDWGEHKATPQEWWTMKVQDPEAKEWG